MLSFKQHLQQRSSPFATKKTQQTLVEGTELSASDLLDELTAPMAKSISATVVTDNEDKLTIMLQVKKWSVTNGKREDSRESELTDD